MCERERLRWRAGGASPCATDFISVMRERERVAREKKWKERGEERKKPPPPHLSCTRARLLERKVEREEREE